VFNLANTKPSIGYLCVTTQNENVSRAFKRRPRYVSSHNQRNKITFQQMSETWPHRKPPCIYPEQN